MELAAVACDSCRLSGLRRRRVEWIDSRGQRRWNDRQPARGAQRFNRNRWNWTSKSVLDRKPRGEQLLDQAEYGERWPLHTNCYGNHE